MNVAGTNDYKAATDSVTITVNPAPLTVTATGTSMAYGDAVPALTYTYTGLVNHDTSAAFAGSLATSATSSSDVANYAITQGTLVATGNYTIGTFNPGTLPITKANQTITWSNPSAIVYGTALGATQLDATVSVVGPAPAGAVTYSPASGTVLVAGSGQTLTVNVAGTKDYDPATDSVTITVNPAPLTITANNQSKVYGQANPTLTVSYSGFVNGDTASSLTIQPTVTTTATTLGAAGSYPIVVSGAASPNYVIHFANGTLTITPTNSTGSPTPTPTSPTGTPTHTPLVTVEGVSLEKVTVIKGKKHEKVEALLIHFSGGLGAATAQNSATIPSPRSLRARRRAKGTC